MSIHLLFILILFLSFLPIDLCAFSPFLFFLPFCLFCYASNICLHKPFTLSVLWAETLSICVLLHLMGAGNSLYYLEHISLLNISRKKSQLKLHFFRLCISKATGLPLLFLWKILFIWMTYKEYPQQNDVPVVYFLLSSYTSNF